MELAEELVCIGVHEHAWIWYRSFGQWVIHDVGDKHEETVKHPAEKKKFGLVSGGWCKVNGAVAWKKWCSRLSLLCEGCIRLQ